MGIIFISDALLFFIPIGVGRPELGIFSKELFDHVAIVVMEKGQKAGDHIACFGLNCRHARKDNGGAIKSEVVH
jgi:hypothetical protein